MDLNCRTINSPLRREGHRRVEGIAEILVLLEIPGPSASTRKASYPSSRYSSFKFEKKKEVRDRGEWSKNSKKGGVGTRVSY